jgi:hypothetical protein
LPAGLGGGFDFVGNDNAATTTPNLSSSLDHEFEDGHNEWLGNSMQQYQSDASLSLIDEQHDSSNRGNGLYWFWDNIWDVTQ